MHLEAPLADEHCQVGAAPVPVHLRELREHGDGVTGVDRTRPARGVSALAGSLPLALGHLLKNGLKRDIGAKAG
jgi:hypothetical protein